MPGLASLSKSLITKLGERRSQVCLLELDETDKPVGDYMVFQYFPETISDTKAVNYQSKDIPGGSVPLYQWVSSGERAISFEAVFTSDVDLLRDKKAFTNLKTKGALNRNVDVRTAILWLRRYLYPRYEDDQALGVPLTKAPRKMVLFIPNSGIGLSGGSISSGKDFFDSNSISGGDPNVAISTGVKSTLAHSMTAIMTQCDVVYEAWFPSGLPRIVVIQLQFVQIAQLAGQVNFPRAGDDLDEIVKSGSDSIGVAPYPIKVTFR